MKRPGLTLALIALTALPALADTPQPHNDYGVMSEEVVRQRLIVAGHTNIRLVKTKTGYEATTMKDGRPQALVIDAVRMTIKPRVLPDRIPVPAPTK